MKLHSKFSLAALLGLSAAAVFAQDGPPPVPPAPPAGGNYIINGDFTKFSPQENLWDGVDSQNILCGNRKGTYAVMESGRLGDQELATGVNFVDMNGDKLPDLVTSDPQGVLRVYFNSGTAIEPKFTVAETIPLFPPSLAKDSKWDTGWWTRPHGIPKVTMADWTKRGMYDLIYGDYIGDIAMIANAGSPMVPSFPQPATYAKVRIPTGKRQWGNLFAPYAIDWNGDGKMDLLVGEGSYSANAVYVLLNQSAGSEPKFNDEQRYYLCYGDGREQLVPTVADWNADGLPDVLVGDRKGTVGVYLNPGNWKPGTELPLKETINFGTTTNLGTGVAPCAADYNGDGLFDIIIGRSNGRISVALNTGTKGAPKFGAPVDIKGANLWGDNLRPPQVYHIDNGNNRGNIYGYISVIDEASPGGGKVLRSGYYPSPNKIIKLNELSVDGKDDEEDYFHYWYDEWYPVRANWAAEERPLDTYIIRQDIANLKVGATYTLSFMIRGKGIREGKGTIAFIGANENKPTRFAKATNGRGAKVIKDETKEIVLESEKFTSQKAWTKVEKTFQVHFKDKNIKKLDVTTLAMLEFKFQLVQYLGECDICDVKLVEKTK